MKRTTIFINEEIEVDIKHIAKVRGENVSQIIREALREYIERKKSERNLSFVGIGKSGEKDISETHEERLWERE